MCLTWRRPRGIHPRTRERFQDLETHIPASLLTQRPLILASTLLTCLEAYFFQSPRLSLPMYVAGVGEMLCQILTYSPSPKPHLTLPLIQLSFQTSFCT